MSEPIKAGVVGVGAMGRHHARIYHELPETELVGVCDADPDRAAEVAEKHDTLSRDWEALRAEVDAVSIAVPTQYHYDFVKDCIEHDIPVLVEKPFVKDIDEGRELVRLAEKRDVPIQVGHVERFNPAVETLADYVSDLDIIAVSAQRLNPPVSRDIDDNAVFDLMIHDLDILLSLVEGDVENVASMKNSRGQYAAAELQFDDGTIGQLTASRVTQRRVRELTVTAEECHVHVDYADQTVEVHRQGSGNGTPEEDKVVERLTVDDDEPLKNELRSFVDVVTNGGTPPVSGRDGLHVVELTSRIDERKQLAASRGEA